MKCIIMLNSFSSSYKGEYKHIRSILTTVFIKLPHLCVLRSKILKSDTALLTFNNANLI